MSRALPWIVAAAALAWAASGLWMGPEHGFPAAAFGALPVLSGGRLQPLDSVARNSLLQIHGRGNLILADGSRLGADQWLLAATMNSESAASWPLFRVDNPEILALIGIPDSRKYVSFAELSQREDALAAEAERVRTGQPNGRSAYEAGLIQLYQALALYDRLILAFRPQRVSDFSAALRDYEAAIGPGLAAVHARERGASYDAAALDRLLAFLAVFKDMADDAPILAVPPSGTAAVPPSGTAAVPPSGTAAVAPDSPAAGQKWRSIGASLMEAVHGGGIPPAARAYALLADSYRGGDEAGFRRALAAYRAELERSRPSELRRTDFETFYNAYAPFAKAIPLYLIALLLGLFSWFGPSRALSRSSLAALSIAWVLHTLGLVARVYIGGRPPVTNLYSSAVFVGWGVVAISLLIERRHRDGMAAVAASLAGFLTQVIAQNLAQGGDTMEALRAVLNANFWLATHVVAVTLGYASTFLAGLLGAIFIVRGVATSSLEPATVQRMSRTVYGVVAFATLFSFTGTVLGGIWADQSWGRFWGWDPKENGALLIVLWNAVILHALWDGMVHERGLMVMAVLGNIVTAFSWFGVNQLGIGLHSYGFNDAGSFWLYGVFMPSQLLVAGLGLAPQRLWRSRLPRAPRQRQKK